MPPADFVITEPVRGGFLLIRYTDNGTFAGDTWHASEEEARAQATFEYILTEWHEIPDDADDPVDYASHARR